MAANLLSRQRGFTLVQISAIVIAAVVLVVAGVFSWRLYQDWRVGSFRSDLQQLESWLWRFQDRKGRWPGDCDGDGVMAFTPPHVAHTDDLPADGPAGELSPCRALGEALDTPFRELADLGIVDTDASPQALAGHRLGGVFLVGADEAADGFHNVIVAYDVPTWLAQRVDQYFDGRIAGDDGRIRRWDAQVTGAPWPTGNADHEAVALAFFFDRPLPGKAPEGQTP